MRPGCKNRRKSADADSRTAEINSTVAEAPRPAREQMGWQVSWLAGQRTLPPSRPAAFATSVSGIRQALVAYSCGGSRGFESGPFGTSTRTTFPHGSLVRARPSRPAVHRCALTLSMATDRACRRALLLWSTLCSTLKTVSGARIQLDELASETGSRCERHPVAHNSGAAPATVSETRRIMMSLRRRTVWEDVRPPQAFASPETGLASTSNYRRGGRMGYVHGHRGRFPVQAVICTLPFSSAHDAGHLCVRRLTNLIRCVRQGQRL